MVKNNLPILPILLIFAVMQVSCNRKESAGSLKADAQNGGIKLPAGFSALIVADNLGDGRHLAVRDNGDIYLALQNLKNGYGIVAMRDTTGDGKVDIIKYFGKLPGTGIRIHKDYLYFAADTCIVRYKLTRGMLVPETDPEIIVYGFKREHEHSAKTIAFDSSGYMYVNVGAPSNACQLKDRVPHSPGMDPCPILEKYGGIWRFKDDKISQTQELDGLRYATGLRNCVAITWNENSDHLYVVQHGRDQLSQFYPEYFTDSMSANLPAEEFFVLDQGDDCGWPYCYYDDHKGKKVLAPEYGGNGDSVERCSGKKQPIMTFPAHTAPNDLMFYTSNMFPANYMNGAFIAFHGSWNRSPLEQKGYYVAFVPFSDGLPSGNWEIFADGFAGSKHIVSPGDAVHRPMGLAQGSDGSLYISDSEKGTIWRVFYNKED